MQSALKLTYAYDGFLMVYAVPRQAIKKTVFHEHKKMYICNVLDIGIKKLSVFYLILSRETKLQERRKYHRDKLSKIAQLWCDIIVRYENSCFRKPKNYPSLKC